MNLKVGDIVYVKSIPAWTRFSIPIKLKIVSIKKETGGNADYYYPISAIALEDRILNGIDDIEKGMQFGIYYEDISKNLSNGFKLI